MRAAVAMVSVLALAACGEGPAEQGTVIGTPELAVVEDAPEPVTEPDAAEPAAPTECAEGEDVLFACSVDGGKRIAVCGKDGNAQYRFGGSNAELTLDNGKFASVPYSGGGEAQIGFSNGETNYIVFSRVVRTNFTAGEPNNPKFTDGVAVVRGETLIAERLCTGEPQSVDVMAGENYGGVADEIFYPG